jgi:hypothetical protein
MDTKKPKGARADERRRRWAETFAKFDVVDAKLVSASTREPIGRRRAPAFASLTKPVSKKSCEDPPTREAANAQAVKPLSVALSWVICVGGCIYEILRMASHPDRKFHIGCFGLCKLRWCHGQATRRIAQHHPADGWVPIPL